LTEFSWFGISISGWYLVAR